MEGRQWQKGKGGRKWQLLHTFLDFLIHFPAGNEVQIIQGSAAFLNLL